VRLGSADLLTRLLDEDPGLLEARDDQGLTPLRIAVEEGRPDLVDILLSRGADAATQDDHGYTPLHLAKSREVADLLIAKGADIDARNNYGLVPLHTAVLEDYREVAVSLISHGCDIHAVERKGFTPLAMADSYGLPEMAELLRRLGAAM
jgi:ankyrin repeat protein